MSLFSADGQHLGRGLWDPSSPIAVRVYSVGDAPLDAATMSARVARAIELRDTMFDLSDTDAFRLCNGEGDRMPGVVLDRYANVAVARFDGDAIEPWANDVLAGVWPLLQQRGIDSLLIRDPQRGKAQVRQFAGSAPPPRVQVRERGMVMLVDVMHGQKTGAFLDQRENRSRVRQLSSGARVLNLFSYAGGFSCSAALGGASHVTSVDVAHPAHALAQETFRLNDIEPSQHTFVTSDVFAFLEDAARRNERYHVVISDPPSFAPSERALPRALQAYRRLHEACARVVARGGILCAASCSSHVTAELFLSTLDDAVLGSRPFVVQELFGQPCDHPTPAAFAEGRYLKFAVLREASARAQRGPSRSAV